MHSMYITICLFCGTLFLCCLQFLHCVSFHNNRTIFSFDDSWKRFFYKEIRIWSSSVLSLLFSSVVHMFFSSVPLFQFSASCIHTVRHLVVWDCVCERKSNTAFVWWNYYLFLLLLSFGSAVVCCIWVRDISCTQLHTTRPFTATRTHTCMRISF